MIGRPGCTRVRATEKQGFEGSEREGRKKEGTGRKTARGRELEKYNLLDREGARARLTERRTNDSVNDKREREGTIGAGARQTCLIRRRGGR